MGQAILVIGPTMLKGGCDPECPFRRSRETYRGSDDWEPYCRMGWAEVRQNDHARAALYPGEGCPGPGRYPLKREAEGGEG
jgi:hypothetical protein